jgi:hypothetical protein
VDLGTLNVVTGCIQCWGAVEYLHIRRSVAGSRSLQLHGFVVGVYVVDMWSEAYVCSPAYQPFKRA